MDEQEREILLNTYMITMVHIGDGDILGDTARELLVLLKKRYPEIYPKLHELVYGEK